MSSRLEQTHDGHPFMTACMWHSRMHTHTPDKHGMPVNRAQRVQFTPLNIQAEEINDTHRAVSEDLLEVGGGLFKNFWQHPAPQDHAKTQQPLAMLYETPSQGQGLPEGSRHHAPSHSEHTHAHAWARDMESTEKPTAFCGYQQQAAHMRHDLHARATWRALAQHTSTDRSIKARAHMP